MPLFQLIGILVVVGIALYLINKYIPMDAKIQRILNVTVVIAIILWLLSLFGLFNALQSIRVGPVK